MEGLSTYSDSDEQSDDNEISQYSEKKLESVSIASEQEGRPSKSSLSSTDSKAPESRPTADQEPAKKRKLLPSSSALLAGTSGKPSFLVGASANVPVFEIPAEDISTGKVAGQAPTDGQQNSESKESVPAPSSATSIRPVTAAGSASASKDAQKKGDVKDKLKAARLKGQSAHARWKSEGEMLLRQQYD